jgi:ADP-ribose pyrophosphatase YjhB (NUDIX family)
LPTAGDDAKEVKVVALESLLDEHYVFDHRQIIEDYLRTRKEGGRS